MPAFNHPLITRFASKKEAQLRAFAGPHRAELRDALCQLLEGRIPCKRVGICSNLVELLSLTDIDGDNTDRLGDDAVYKFTGDPSPISGYWDAKHGEKWEGEQLLARQELLAAMIAALE